MIQPDVVLSDYLLAAEGSIFAWILLRRPARDAGLRAAFTVFFASLSISALCGGTVHGYFRDEATIGHAILWPGTMLGIGLTAASAWVIGASLLLPPRGVVAARWLAAIAFVAYAAAVVSGARAFRVAIGFYLPAAVFLGLAYLALALRARSRAGVLGLAGVILTFAAAALQQSRIGLPGLGLSHNALYHTLQGVALYPIYLAAGILLRESRRSGKTA